MIFRRISQTHFFCATSKPTLFWNSLIMYIGNPHHSHLFLMDLGTPYWTLLYTLNALLVPYSSNVHRETIRLKSQLLRTIFLIAFSVYGTVEIQSRVALKFRDVLFLEINVGISIEMTCPRSGSFVFKCIGITNANSENEKPRSHLKKRHDFWSRLCSTDLCAVSVGIVACVGEDALAAEPEWRLARRPSRARGLAWPAARVARPVAGWLRPASPA